ncbi:asparagine synthase-related protein [Streptomyces klenkii]
MLKFRISLGDLARGWTPAAGRWSAGESWIEPLFHPMLETRTATDGRGWALTVRERCADSAPGHAVLSDGALESAWRAPWPLDSITLYVTADRVRLLAGQGGTAPLYLAYRDGVLTGSWDLAGLRAHTSANGLVLREAARLLSGHQRYGHETLHRGVHLLTVGSVAVADRSGLSLTYPAAVGTDQPRAPHLGADMIDAWERAVGLILRARPWDPARSAVQLSGGQDSATVALSLGRSFPGQVSGCVMTLPGPVGAQQERRRDHLFRAARLGRDVRVPALASPPLWPGGVRRAAPGMCTAYDEPYAEALSVMVRSAARGGVHTMVTGFGGDELMAVRHQRRARPGVGERAWLGPVARDAAAERESGIAPPTAVPETALLALRTASPVLLRSGVWPVAPLMSPDLVRFARWLPEEWRTDKRIMRARLRRYGLPEWVVQPRRREVFTDVMAHSMHRYGPGLLRRIARGPLVELGLLDARGLHAVADACASSPGAAREHTDAYTPIALGLYVESLG